MHPEALEDNHPRFTTLDLEWSLTGKWVGVPKSSTAFVREGEEVHNYNVARVESYIDKDGFIRSAMASGFCSGSIMVWYESEEVKDFFKLWAAPDTPKWANTKKWSVSALLDRTKKEPKIEGNMKSSQRVNPRGAYRGNNRGRGRGG